MDPSPPEARTTIDLKILSPSPEVGPRGLQLHHLSVNTTIRALKNAITNSIPSHPGPERQRLIYLGRALARDDQELLDIFGREAIQNDANHTLHLVLREAVTSNHRPASVPPQSSNPFRTTITNPPVSTIPTPVQRNPFASPQPAAPEGQQPQQAPPQPQPQPQAQAANPLAHILANANIRATSNGVPINLPPEVINQLLNQRLAQEGTFNLLANLQRPQPPAQPPGQPPSQPTSAPNSNPSSEGPSPLQQHWAQHQQALAANFAAGVPMDRQTSESVSRGRDSHAGEPQAGAVSSGGPRRSSGQEEQTNASATPAVSTPGTSGSPAPNGLPQPHAHTFVRAGINPDGSRWQTTTVQYEGPNHHHHHHPPGAIPAHIPGQIAGQIPLLQPLPRMPPQFPLQALNPAMHLRMGTPPTSGPGLRAAATPRSASPARSVSETPRRVATPAAELQQRLNETMREVGNVNRLLTVLANGHLANGGPAQPLSDIEREQLRITAHNMNQHIDGFGTDLAALINGHPNMRTDPDFAALNSLYQAVQAQGRAIRNQVGNITANQGPPPVVLRGGGGEDRNTDTVRITFSEGMTTTQNQPTAMPSSNMTQQQSSNSAQNASPPEVHLLTDPAGTPQALLVGPTGSFISPPLSSDVMNALVAAQLPHDQLVQQFNRGIQQMINANTAAAQLTGNAQLLQALNSFAVTRQTGQAGADDEAVIQRMNYILGQERGRREARRTRRRNAEGRLPRPVVAQNAAGGADAQVQARQLAVAPNRPQQQQQVARGANNEARDMLAPIIRNIWLAVRIAGFAYFFLASGRGYWRLLLLGGIALVIYALNSGWLGRNVDGAWEALRRHFEALVNDARRGNPIAPTAAQAERANAVLTPEDAARRLLQEHQRRNRSAMQEFIDRAVARARQAERTFALFIASLWPGVGEGVIRAQEQARREERERIEAERKRKEDEEAKQKEEEEAKQKEQEAGETSSSVESSSLPEPTITRDEGTASGSMMNGGLSRVNKGKAKAEGDEENK